MQINWDNFKIYNLDPKGICHKFEDLCRQLFAKENLSGNKQFRYLHADPNNPGIETEPVFDEVNQRWVGFQAKYFTQNPSYTDIKDSAENTVKNYAGRVDHVFLFCNKPLKRSSLTDTENLLQDANITMELVTDEAILDLVRNKYPSLGLYYFGDHSISQDWIETHTKYMFYELGERYNKDFNVGTHSEIELALFLHEQLAVDYLNKRKQTILDEIDSKYIYEREQSDYIKCLRGAIEKLPDINVETLSNAIDWVHQVETEVRPFLDDLQRVKNDLEANRAEAYEKGFKRDADAKERNIARRNNYDLDSKISMYDSLLGLPYLISVSDREKQLLQSSIMTLCGQAGTGKSHMLASMTSSILADNRAVLLLVAGIYFTDDLIQEQIMKNLNLDYNFERLIDILEVIGERNNHVVPIIIDALNETWNKKLWKTGLLPIIDKVKASPFVKLVISYRTEYESTVLPEMIIKEKQEGKIVTIIHRGFEDNSIEAIKDFMNQYNIPFAPLDYFGYEMSNPLFLSLYCKTYNGEDVSLPELYERVIMIANSNIHIALAPQLKTMGYSGDEDLVSPLINEIAEYLVNHNERSISKNDLKNLSYWADSGLTVATFVRQLIKEHILHDYQSDDDEMYYFAFDQMNDYYCAKAVCSKFESKSELKNYLSETVLGILDGKLKNPWNIDLFVNSCAIYAGKFSEECIDIIDKLIDEDDQYEAFSRYISSFQWRDLKSFSKEQFNKMLGQYPCALDNLWKMLIGNSVKVHHPLNADYLHEFLSSYELNRRDYIWTTYINDLTIVESDRIVQLIKMYDRGDKLEIRDSKQIELFLTLLSWLLTSSNRWLRDNASKAMIEMLKDDISLCQSILIKFETVNDPYVVQRLYGVVLGVCCKRNSGDLQELAEYVYKTVFLQDKVYPDILLRDYARLIVERFLYEVPDYSGMIEKPRIMHRIILNRFP